MRRILALAVCAALALSGCSQVRDIVVPRTAMAEVPAKGDAKAPVGPALPAANSDFGFRLLRAMDASGAGPNTLLSPFSVTSALAMTANGADAKTRAVMERTLFGERLSLTDANAAYADLLARLQTDTPTSKLAIANSLWLAKDERISPAFLQTDRDYYAAEVATVTFGTAEANKRIDGWVNDRTRGLIPELFGSTPIPDTTVMVLVNALYFKADWAHEFDTQATRDATFTTASGPVEVPMMSTDAEFGYLQTPRFTAARLPYKDGRRALYLFVPRYTDAEKLSANPNMGSPLGLFLGELDAQRWDEWMRGFQDTPEVHVEMPKMTLKTRVPLNEPLKALGMGPAFEGGLEPMLDRKTDGPIAITDVLHAVTVEIDEKGTKAAAATGVVVGTTAAAAQTMAVVADRPFFFAIRDEASGVVLFAGAVRDPRR